MVSNSLNPHHGHACSAKLAAIWKFNFGATFFSAGLAKSIMLLMVGVLLLSPLSLHAASIDETAAYQTDLPKAIHPSANAPLSFIAELQAGNAVVRWQVPETESGWFYEIYRSPDCSWENAVAVDAPIFSSTESITTTVSYSVVDAYSIASSSGAVGVTCNYWLLGTDSDGNAQIFEVAMLQGIKRFFLPIVLTGALN